MFKNLNSNTVFSLITRPRELFFNPSEKGGELMEVGDLMKGGELLEEKRYLNRKVKFKYSKK